MNNLAYCISQGGIAGKVFIGNDQRQYVPAPGPVDSKDGSFVQLYEEGTTKRDFLLAHLDDVWMEEMNAHNILERHETSSPAARVRLIPDRPESEVVARPYTPQGPTLKGGFFDLHTDD